ncbi:phage Gp37/Gp68 family protein [Corallococcus exercitus]|uniref:Phage Gp37/Gp68 family protein n=1 Tax=Corallococcus exercitus TaxID=2316736 RepID=A0A7Y4NW34_9BACT|nr:phage Gp37/Gp68 family protein [Corallococcus exercitus]
MGKTSIEWTDATWNPVRGCTKVSPGCKHCYAETFAERFRGVPGHPYEQGFALRLVPEKLQEPLRWREPRRVFVNSMSDLFHPDVPNEYIAACFCVMASQPSHTFQVLTKRAERMREWFAWLERGSDGAIERYLSSPMMVEGRTSRAALVPPRDEPPPPTRQLRHLYDVGAELVNRHMPGGRFHHLRSLGERHWRDWPLSNVWLGVSVEDRKYGLPRIEHLRQTPAAVRVLSVEPLLEDLGTLDLRGIHQVIVGGESGPGARALHPDWVRSIRDQCTAAGVAFFFKQWGGVRKKVAGRVLDGRTWDEMPEVVRG